METDTSREVTLCDICGVEGFRECLVACTQCNERAEHIYCMQAFCDALPPSWVCELCKLAEIPSCEVQSGTFVPNIDCNRSAQILHEVETLNDQSVPDQEQVEIEESAEGRLNNKPRVPAGRTTQVGTSSDINVDSDSKLIPSQEQTNFKRPHHGAKGPPSSKLRASSASQAKESEDMPSFLLPSRPKILPKSKSTCSSLAHANKKAEQPRKPKHVEDTSGLHKTGRSLILRAPLNSENLLVKGFECYAPRNPLHAGVLDHQSTSPGFLGKQLSLPSGACTHYGPPLAPNYPQLAGSEKQQPEFLNPYQGRPFGQYKPAMPHFLPQMLNSPRAQNAATVLNIPPYVPSIPHVQKLWRGSFDVDLGDNTSKLYKGIQGHPSSKADPKVWEAARSLPRQLKVKELRRGLDDSTWPEGFSLSPPTTESIDIFFFPVNMESHDSWYKPLVNRMIADDLMLRSESAFLYLLIFHSRLFPESEQLWDGRHYLWGMFRPKRIPVMRRASMLQSVPGASDNTEVVDMEIDTNDNQPCRNMGEEPPLPPLPPGSPPAEPPPPPLQQSCDPAAAKHQTVLQTGSNGESKYEGEDLKAFNDASVDDSVRSSVDNASQGSRVGNSSSCSPVFKKSTHVAALNKREHPACSHELQHPIQLPVLNSPEAPATLGLKTKPKGGHAHSPSTHDCIGGNSSSGNSSGCLLVFNKSSQTADLDEPQLSTCLGKLQPIQLPVLMSPEIPANLSSKTNSNGGSAHSPSTHDCVGGNSSCSLLQPSSKKISNGFQRKSKMAEPSGTTKRCSAAHALSNGMQDKKCPHPSGRADSTTQLMDDDIGKGFCDMAHVRDVIGCEDASCLPLFPVQEFTLSHDTTGLLTDLVCQGGYLSDLSWQALSLVQQLDKPWYGPHASLDSVISEETTDSLDINADLTLRFPQYRKHGNIWIKDDSDTRLCFDTNIELALWV